MDEKVFTKSEVDKMVAEQKAENKQWMDEYAIVRRMEKEAERRADEKRCQEIMSHVNGMILARVKTGEDPNVLHFHIDRPGASDCVKDQMRKNGFKCVSEKSEMEEDDNGNLTGDETVVVKFQRRGYFW